MINCCLQYLHRHVQYRVKLPKTLIDLIIQGVVRREHAYVTTEGGGHGRLLGIFNIGSWDGRDFYGEGLGEIFLHFFSIPRICKAGFRNVHNCARVPGTEVLYLLYMNARLINPASRDFFYTLLSK